MNIQEFIKANNIEMEFLPAKGNPSMEEGNKMVHFTVSINGGAMVITYSVGCGIVERWIIDTNQRRHSIGYSSVRNGKEYAKCKKSVDGRNFYNEMVKYYKPDPADILDCIASDASGTDQVGGFEDWCGEYGYDIDSRKAEAIYNEVNRQSRALRAMLGRKDYDQLLYDVERL